jgi:hypothetical protein
MLSLVVTAVPEALAASSLLNSVKKTTARATASTTMPVRKHGPYMLSEVYEVEPGDYGAITNTKKNPDRIAPNRCFRGTKQTYENVRVVPGILCLDTTEDFALNIAAFATCAEDEVGEPYVQSFRLTKCVPGSYKAPCYGDPRYPPVYCQFGSKGVSTWWALKYTQPGTTFTLELTVRCQKYMPGSSRLRPVMHIDRWEWVVGVTPETFPLVIDMLHSTPLSVLEIPCIADEGVYAELKRLAKELKYAVESDAYLYDKQEALFALEGFILEQCMYADWLFPSYLDPEDPRGFEPSKIPGNFPTQSESTYGGGGMGNWCPYSHYGGYDDAPDGGIVESFEDPCCCKLMADVEYIGEKYGIAQR